MGHSLWGLFASPPRRILAATAIIITVLCGGAYAYWVSLPLPRTAGPSVSITSTPLQLSIGLDKTEYATTDNLTVYFSLRNISNRTITVAETDFSYVGLGPPPGFTLTTSAEGVTTLEEGGPGSRFHFGFTWGDSNETLVQEPLINHRELLYMLLEPKGCLNQTLHISIPDFWTVEEIRSPRTGAFQIRGSLPGVYIDEITATSVTLETPSIAFTIS